MRIHYNHWTGEVTLYLGGVELADVMVTGI